MRAWNQIARTAWAVLEDPSLTIAVRPSLPILYFGDLEGYRASPLRVITVGLNPSRREFPIGAPFRRFPGGDKLAREDVKGLLRVLNGYFRAEPYRSWFGSYEPVLNGLDASYYETHRSTALHTDLFSPIATDPTWSRLTKAQRAPLRDAGVRLWHDIAAVLRPHLVVLSVARRHLQELRFDFDSAWNPIGKLSYGRTGPRTKPYVVEARTTAPSDQPTFVFGHAAQQPFGTVAGKDRVAIGRRIREVLAL